MSEPVHLGQETAKIEVLTHALEKVGVEVPRLLQEAGIDEDEDDSEVGVPEVQTTTLA